MMLFSLDQGKAHLRVDHDDEDADISLKINAASSIVMNYLKLPLDHYQNTAGEVVNVPFEVIAAAQIMLGYIFKDRDAAEMDKWQHGYLPFTVTSLLYPLRDPSLA